jgi:hypothetical protein
MVIFGIMEVNNFFMKTYFLCCLCILFYSCNRINNSISNKKSQDTIRIIASYLNIKSTCFDSVDNYYSRFGVFISNYYVIKDSLDLDVNKDGFVDHLVLLSPVSLEYYYDCDLDSVPTRLLIEIINQNGTYKIRNIYPNLISNVGGVLSKYYGMKITSEGFEIQHSSGNKYTWTYTTEYSTKFSDSIYLKKITKECGINLNRKIQEYNYIKYPLGHLNINDTLNNNCGCDILWNELELKNDME